MVSGVIEGRVAANMPRSNSKQDANEDELYISAWSGEAGGIKYALRSYYAVIFPRLRSVEIKW